MEYETYADVIDAYNADNMGYSTLTDYIKGQNIKIKEIEMDPIGDMQKIFENKADGGMIGIEVLFGPKREDFNIGGNVQRATTPQPYDSRATAADFARAIDRVGAGTDLQKAIDIDRYGKNIQRQNMLNRIQKMNPAGTGNFLQGIKDFGKHAVVSEAMAGKTGKSVIPEYGFQTGLDFQEKFSGLDPKISAGLAAAYQTLQEGSRALNPFNPSKFLRFPTAMKTAQEQATKNIEGILASDTGTITPQQQAERNKYLASQGQPIDPVIDQSRISEIVEQQKAAGVPETGLITNFQQDDGSSIIPNFEKLSDTSYRDTRTGDIYGAETYASIAAGMYPNIYDPNKQTLADGGRVGLFMGGPPLEGQALSIYNSMNAYGFSDEEIANALREQGYEIPGAGKDLTQPVRDTGIINQQLQTGGDGGDGGSNVPTGSKFATLEKTYDPTKNYGEFFSGVKGTPSMVSNYQTPPTFIEGLLSIPGKLVEGYMDISSKFNPITRFIKDRAERQQTLQDNAIAKAEAERKAREEIARAEAEAAALANAQRIGRRPTAPSGDGGGGVQDSGGPTGGYSYDSGGREGFGYGLKDGGLATMFTRRR